MPASSNAGSVLRSIFARDKAPWTFIAIAFAAVLVQLNAGWRSELLYDRSAIAAGEWWRIWSAQLVHFGWPHFVADAGLFIVLGRLLDWRHPWLTRFAIVFMPLVIAATLYWLDPSMNRYGGLSAVNLGLLIFLACQGWQKNWIDWFWPSVLAIYLAEIVLESTVGSGHGGGMIRFDDPSIHVATAAHVAAAIFGVLLWGWTNLARKGNEARVSQKTVAAKE